MHKLITLLIIVLSTNLFAQDQVAKDVLKRMSETSNSYKNMTFTFTFTFENKSQNITETQNGILVIQGESYRIEMKEQIIINNGESQWVYLTDMNEVQIMEHDPEDEMMNLNKLFTIYEEEYKYTYIEEKSLGTLRVHIIDLFPKESGPFIKVRLHIDSEKDQLHKITIYDKSGGTYTYLVTLCVNNTSIKPFIFDDSNYPGIEIIDLR